jgi:hypothetical protein
MFNWIYDIPTWTMVVIVTSTLVGVTWMGTILVRPILNAFVRSEPGKNSIVSSLLGSHGTFFGILLGLLALSAYENLTDTEEMVTSESSRLAALYRDISAYPEPTRSVLQGKLREYTRYVIEEAWPLQQKGIIPAGGTKIVTQFQNELVKFEPQTKGQEILHAEAMSIFNSFIEARRLRLYSVEGGIPALMWYVVWIGVAINMVLIWLLDMRLLPHLLLGAISTLFLATLIALVAAMDHPFLGEVSISPKAYEIVYRDLMLATDIVTSPSAPADKGS